jgi:hypothetical protein
MRRFLGIPVEILLLAWVTGSHYKNIHLYKK